MKQVLLGVFVVMSGCTTAKKCASKFPVKESIEYIRGTEQTDTTYLPGAVVTFRDTIRVKCDSAGQVIARAIEKAAPCPPNPVITRIKVDTVVKTIENTARVEAADQRTAKEQRAKERANKWLKWILGYALTLTGFLVFKYRKLLGAIF